LRTYLQDPGESSSVASPETRAGLQEQVRATLALCTDRVNDYYGETPQHVHGFYCSAARFNLNCRYTTEELRFIMRRTAAAALAIAASGAFASAASAQLVQLGRDHTYKAGPLTCVTGKPVTPGPAGQKATGCTLTIGPERSVFCGTEKRYPRFDLDYESYTFRGCRVQAGPYLVECGITDTELILYVHVYDVRHRYGCRASAGTQGMASVSCEEINHGDPYGPPEDNGDFYLCRAGPVNLLCPYGNSPPTYHPTACRLTLGTLVTCDIDFADPAGSLVACASGTVARI
jgi:hypothetical protein